MKNIIQFTILAFIIILLKMCTVKSNGKWESQETNLELNFNDKWELIIPNLDSKDKILVGIKDNTDNSSMTIKITKDVPKEELSDNSYLNAIKEQMLNTNPENELLVRDKIEFKETNYNRMIFFMKTKFGEMIHTIYIHRNGEKMIGIQFTYPKKPIENSGNKMPDKIEKLLNELKI